MTGITCPVFGVTSHPTKAEIDHARRLVNMLEDKRVLYNPYELEDPNHCIQSVVALREMLNDQLDDVNASAGFASSIKAMRAACRKLLDNTQPTGLQRPGFFRRGLWGQNEFFDALGELRGVFGVHLAQIAVGYGLDVEDELASILPARDEDEEPTRRRQRRPQRDAKE